jgi:hypothetical protein
MRRRVRISLLPLGRRVGDEGLEALLLLIVRCRCERALEKEANLLCHDKL